MAFGGQVVLAHDLTGSQFRPVRAEKPVQGSDQQGCRPSRLTVMVTGHVPAVRFPPDQTLLAYSGGMP